MGVKKNRDFDYRKAAADLDGAGAHDPEEIYVCRSEKAIRSYMSEYGLKADKYFKQDKREPGAKKDDEGCFFTTACVEARGLPDDCEALETLRAFRDACLANRPDGREAIAEYYRMAPASWTRSMPGKTAMPSGIGCMRSWWSPVSR